MDQTDDFRRILCFHTDKYISLFYTDNSVSVTKFKRVNSNTAVKSQNAVSAYLQSKQIVPFWLCTVAYIMYIEWF